MKVTVKKDIQIVYKESLFLNESEMCEQASVLLPYLSSLNELVLKGGYEALECSLNLISDEEQVQKIQTLAGSFLNEQLKYVIVVGIGGSNLGTAAVYEALYGKTDLFLSRTPKILFADTTNEREMELIKKVLEENVSDSREIVLNIVTKSGTTTETVANAGFLFNVLKQKFGEKVAAERTVVTTDKDSSLERIALEKGMSILSIPRNVGGRYSVFSAVGLFPLALFGIDISELLSGARTMRDVCLKNNSLENKAIIGAVTVYLQNKKNLTLYNSFFFNSELESLGKWWRQLFAESLGKKYDTQGVPVYLGMTPIVSLGSTDLHSMVQLYLGGPKDKITNFIYSEGERRNIFVPDEHPFMSLAPDISGKDFTDIMRAILSGTKGAYREHEIPFLETILPKIDEYSIGQFLQLKMMETMFLAKLWNINAFDQPEVESYKKITKELLKK